MRRVTSFCVLLASSLLLLLHGACSEHAFCRNATDIPKEIERDYEKSVKIFDQIIVYESKNISSVALVSEETNKYKKPMDCMENEKWIDPIFSILTKGKKHDIANMPDVETMKNFPRRTHSRIQKRKLMRVYMRGRFRRAALKSTLKTSRRSRMKFQKRTLRRVVLKRQVSNSGVRHQVSRRRRVLQEKRRFQMRNLSRRKRERISSLRRTMNKRRQARFYRVSARRSRKVNDQKRNRVASFRIRVTTRTMQSSHLIRNTLLKFPQVRNSKSNVSRLSQRTSRRRNLVSKRRRDVYVRSSSQSSRRHTLNSRIRRDIQVNRARKILLHRRNLVVARRNHSLYRRIRRSTRQDRRDKKVNHRASLKRFPRSYRNRFSRERANGQHRRSGTRSSRRYRRVQNSGFSRFSKRRSRNQRRVRSARSRQVSVARIVHIHRRSTRSRRSSGARIVHIHRGNYLDSRETIRSMYQDGNFSDQGNQNRSDVPSHGLMTNSFGKLLQITSTKDVLPSNKIEIQMHSSEQKITTSQITVKTNGEHIFPFDPFQCSKVVITAVGFILGTRVKHI